MVAVAHQAPLVWRNRVGKRGAQRNGNRKGWKTREPLMYRHCEERSDEAISNRLIIGKQIAALRSQ